MALISTRNMSIRFGDHALLRHIDLDIARGEIVALIGPNGSGKTTLLRTLIGALKPSSGSVSREVGSVVGYVPQRLHIDETLPMTVYRFLQLPVRHSAEDLAIALERAGVPSLGGQQLGTLSGGQFQRVLLARAVLDKPDILLLDEASQGLDYAGAKDFYRQIARIQQELGCAIVLVSHELKVVMQTATRVICLSETICCEGSPDDVVSTVEYRSLFGIDDDDRPPSKDNVYPFDSRNQEALNAR